MDYTKDKQRKRWRFYPVQKELADKFQRELGISAPVAQLLLNRGIADLTTARDFLTADVAGLGDPFLLKGMENAVSRIVRAIADQEAITVYGDYDVDGVTACSLLCKTLARLQAKVDYYIPERQSEGYGLNAEALAMLQGSGVSLLITVDCGISSAAEVGACQAVMDIIITDHHQPPAELPPAYAIINPKQTDCGYPDKNLAGVGVAFKLCQALWRHYQQEDVLLLQDLDLVAVGTIADMVPLQGENRIIVKNGLHQLNHTKNIGLQALRTVCGLADKALDCGHVGFAIAPRLNAAGRVNLATAAVELLLTGEQATAKQIAVQLDEENANRQAIEKEILQMAEVQLKHTDVRAAKVLVVSAEGWHSGVIGIVASRLVERYYRPVIIISKDKEIGKGSCRSISGFDMVQALTECQDILIKFGGHKQAAGLTIAVDHIPLLHQRLAAIAAATLTDEDYIPELKVDGYLPVQKINAELLEQMTVMAPHGLGNPAPLFAEQALAVADVRTLGQDKKHLKLRLHTGVAVTAKDVIAWNMGPQAEEIRENPVVDFLFSPQYNEWQGRKSIQLVAKDIRGTVQAPEQERPDRVLVGRIYLLLKELCGAEAGGEHLVDRLLAGLQEKYQIWTDDRRILTGLQVLWEIGLLDTALNAEGSLMLRLMPAPAEKLDLQASPTFRSGRLGPGNMFHEPGVLQMASQMKESGI